MAESNGVYKQLSQLLEKRGLATVMVVVLCWMGVTFLLRPQAEERKILLNAITAMVEDNKRSNDLLVESSKESANYAKRSYEAQDAWQTSMGNFILQVSMDHARIQESVDEILSEVKRP